MHLPCRTIVPLCHHAAPTAFDWAFWWTADLKSALTPRGTLRHVGRFLMEDAARDEICHSHNLMWISAAINLDHFFPRPTKTFPWVTFSFSLSFCLFIPAFCFSSLLLFLDVLNPMQILCGGSCRQFRITVPSLTVRQWEKKKKQRQRKREGGRKKCKRKTCMCENENSGKKFPLYLEGWLSSPQMKYKLTRTNARAESGL